MSLVSILESDTKLHIELLNAISAQGDDPTVARNLEFMMGANSKKDIEKAACFIQDNRFGETTLFECEGRHMLMVYVEMPLHLNAVLSVAGFMRCVCDLFNVEHEEWATDVQGPTSINWDKVPRNC